MNGNGTTFSGDYGALNAAKLDAMRIGPGMAPKASIYGIKVFGCAEGEAGSTLLVAPAIDWALDPEQGRRPAGPPQRREHLDRWRLRVAGRPRVAVRAQRLPPRHALGDLGGQRRRRLRRRGSPGNTPEALTVAGTRDSYELLDALEVKAPAVRHRHQGRAVQRGVRLSGDFTRTAPVARSPRRPTATAAAPIATNLTGKIAWLEWDDNDATRRCGSATRTDNATAAGAVGVLLTTTLTHFAAGISGNAEIPAFQMTATTTNALRPALNAGTLRVRLGADLARRIDFVDPRRSRTRPRASPPAAPAPPGSSPTSAPPAIRSCRPASGRATTRP